ncbi:MAG: prenyltransferase [Bacteroidales bacterium]|nr:prenyltransferase [Bacteroidales bacterium]
MKHSFKEWVAVTRYWSFPVSVMPVVATFAWLFSRGMLPSGPIPYINFALSIIGVVLLHSAGNVISDWYDHKTGVDNEKAFAVPNLVFHKFEPKEYKTFSLILFAAGIIVGLVITCLSGPYMLIVGVAGVLLTYFYSFLKYHALGDLDIFLIFGVLTVLGTTYALTGSYQPQALILSVPIGVITVSVLHANNTYDSETDKEAGIKTFGMLLGLPKSATLYRCYMFIPFICIILYIILGLMHPLAALCFVAAIPAWKNQKQAATYPQNGLEAMKGLDQASAQMQLVFSGLLSVGLIVAGLL